MRVTVFAPDDLQLVKGGPAGRRDYLDDLLVAIAPALRGGPRRLRAGAEAAQRAAAGRPARRRGAHAPSRCSTSSSSRAGAELVRGRLRLLDRLVPGGGRRRTRELAGDARRRSTRATRPSGPTAALDADDRRRRARCATRSRRRRRREIDRGVTLVGPAPRRVAAARRRAREPHARVAGRAAHARAGAAARRAPPVRRAHRQRTGAAARRRVQRARRPARASRSSRTSPPARRWSRRRARCRDGIAADRMLRVDAGRVEEAA